MSMTRLVVLANSWKHSDWCLAGIALDHSAWVRPVTGLKDGRVPRTAMKLDGYFPALLDIIALPLAATGPDYGFEKENRTILPGPWAHHGRMTPRALQPYTTPARNVLHNNGKYVLLSELQQKPVAEQVSLQLVHVTDFKARSSISQVTGAPIWQGVFTSGAHELAVKITDPMFVGKLNAGHQPAPECLLTMSLSMPYTPPNWDDALGPACWKLIAGVIELPTP